MLVQGKSVVRLKGGCPSVFSRCSSELLALDVAGCEAELVPGVSSALAAPLFAGKPVLHHVIGGGSVSAASLHLHTCQDHGRHRDLQIFRDGLDDCSQSG